MLFMFEGRITPDTAGPALTALWDLMKENGIMRLEQMQVSFLGWSSEGRFQVVDKNGFISAMSFGPNVKSVVDGPAYVPSDTTSLRQRPFDAEFNPLAIMFGHDD